LFTLWHATAMAEEILTPYEQLKKVRFVVLSLLLLPDFAFSEVRKN
jgi:hypothetical protein